MERDGSEARDHHRAIAVTIPHAKGQGALPVVPRAARRGPCSPSYSPPLFRPPRRSLSTTIWSSAASVGSPCSPTAPVWSGKARS
ncbi:hypothetical protein MBEBAB_1156 [Brevundimonas abyssalis TAR-001]|uniref:Uncharacterized protein n=1 Tax=Brevundimonas abyssalis TAR-001 TaxID=1391729 RepID=A0A8E0NAW5_9CAUL|nr:hypothetical protein MBEBAB_1156 [Brevundimonas abyssalis TAR-001]